LQFFSNGEWKMNDFFHVAHMTPVLHYTMGGLEIDAESRVLDSAQKPIQGLFAAGEVAGGVHGANRLGGSSLLGCVVFGRVSGDSAAAYLFQQTSAVAGKATDRLGAVAGHLGAPQKQEQQQPATAQASEEKKMSSDVKKGSPAVDGKAYSLEDVAKHNKKDDIWVVVNGQVLDVTEACLVDTLLLCFR
jgi:succinate dehydrogenase/fumarate reductase flavoprotein subunit